jgi:spore coat polysaccharide biosynthesis protein SpsF (cytidylyltransferase family)
MKVFLIARMGSNRLPGKHLLKLSTGDYCIIYLVNSLLKNYSIEDIVLCTTSSSKDDILVDQIISNFPKINIFRGSETNVLDRVYSCCAFYSFTDFIRINADNVLLNSSLIKSIELVHMSLKFDYTSNCEPKSLPDGMSVQIINGSFFKKYHEIVKEIEYNQEHIFDNMKKYTNNYCNISFELGSNNLNDKITSLDNFEDFLKINNNLNE